jgi:hypothetical protein
MTGNERDTVVAHLEKTQKVFEQTVSGVTPQQWSFKPAPDRWSLAEIAEHIAKMEDLLRGFVTGQVVNIPTPPVRGATPSSTGAGQGARPATDRSQRASHRTCPSDWPLQDRG